MRQLIFKATILTPNITEAAFLLNEDIPENSLEKAQVLAEKLVQRFAIPNVIITGITLSKDKMGEVGITKEGKWSIIQEKIAR